MLIDSRNVLFIDLPVTSERVLGFLIGILLVFTVTHGVFWASVAATFASERIYTIEGMRAVNLIAESCSPAFVKTVFAMISIA